MLLVSSYSNLTLEGLEVKIRIISIATLVVVLSLGIVFYLGYVKNHRQPADIGPVDEAGDVPLNPPIERDLEAIKQRGTLTVLAPYEIDININKPGVVLQLR